MKEFSFVAKYEQHCTTLSGTVLENSDLNRMHKEVAVDCFAIFLED